MTAYPFSGTIRNDMIDYPDNGHKNIRYIIDQYCNHYKVDPILLKAKLCGTFVKKTKSGVHLDSMRMALSYFIRDKFDLPYTIVSELVGYKDHSTPIKMRRRIEAYIKNEDPVFYPYWEKLLQVA